MMFVEVFGNSFNKRQQQQTFSCRWCYDVVDDAKFILKNSQYYLIIIDWLIDWLIERKKLKNFDAQNKTKQRKKNIWPLAG